MYLLSFLACQDRQWIMTRNHAHSLLFGYEMYTMICNLIILPHFDYLGIINNIAKEEEDGRQ